MPGPLYFSPCILVFVKFYLFFPGDWAKVLRKGVLNCAQIQDISRTCVYLYISFFYFFLNGDTLNCLSWSHALTADCCRMFYIYIYIYKDRRWRNAHIFISRCSVWVLKRSIVYKCSMFLYDFNCLQMNYSKWQLNENKCGRCWLHLLMFEWSCDFGF